MSRLRAALLVAAVTAGLAACVARPAAGPTVATVGGSVQLPAGAAALPEGALLRVQLLEVSHAGAPATVLAEQYTGLDGRMLPLPFSLCVDRTRIDANARYRVSARITDSNGWLLMSASDTYPVLVHGRGDRPDIMVKPVKP